MRQQKNIAKLMLKKVERGFQTTRLYFSIKCEKPTKTRPYNYRPPFLQNTPGLVEYYLERFYYETVSTSHMHVKHSRSEIFILEMLAKNKGRCIFS